MKDNNKEAASFYPNVECEMCGMRPENESEQMMFSYRGFDCCNSIGCENKVDEKYREGNGRNE